MKTDFFNIELRGKPEDKVAGYYTAHLTVLAGGHRSEPTGFEHVQTFAKIAQLAILSAPF
jgi:hypothetical protein